MSTTNRSKPSPIDSVAEYQQTTLNCEQLETFIADYLDGELKPETNKTFEQHLNRCPPCKVYVDNTLKAIQLSKAALVTEPSREHMPEALIQAILAAQLK
ncbi:MAG: anti-sigma factor RsiW [Cryomorphaceae bacterium]|jgi:anti-sigma factor RsiW